jgi:hypothetical protein
VRAATVERDLKRGRVSRRGMQGGRAKGEANTPEHNEKIAGSVQSYWMDRHYELVADLREGWEAGQIQSALDRILVAMAEQLEDGEVLDKFQRTLISVLKSATDKEK